MEIKEGQIVALTDGEYSDYCLRDHMRALRDFDDFTEAERFKEEGDYLVPPDWDPEGAPEDYGSSDRFIAWLVRERILEPLEGDEVVELHVGSYGQLEILP